MKRDECLVGFFEQSDRKSVVDLWRRTFDDNEDYINNFINLFGEKIIVYRVDGITIGMLSLLDVSLNGYKGGYIYALAVDKQYQKRGVATSLLTFAQETMLNSGYKFSILVPEPYDSLEAFYKKFGFDCEVSLYTTVIEENSFAGTANVVPLNEDEYYYFRKIQPNVLVHSKKMFEYIYEDLNSDGFRFLKVQSDTFFGYCICIIKDDYVIIKEAIPFEQSDNIANQVCEALNIKKAILISSKGKQKHPFALMKCFDNIKSNVYANLLLDSFGG